MFNVDDNPTPRFPTKSHTTQHTHAPFHVPSHIFPITSPVKHLSPHAEIYGRSYNSRLLRLPSQPVILTFPRPPSGAHRHAFPQTERAEIQIALGPGRRNHQPPETAVAPPPAPPTKA